MTRAAGVCAVLAAGVRAALATAVRTLLAVAARAVLGAGVRAALAAGVRAALAAGVCAAPAVASASGAESLRRGLPLEVPAPGWVRAAVFSSPDELGGARWRLLDPGGRELACHVVAGPRGDVPLRAVDVDEGPAGWAIILDAGPVPLVHEGLALDLAGRAIAADMRVEASADRHTWTMLVTGDVFRLGGEGLSRTLLTYAPARQRWLRVRWPRAAGRPDLDGAMLRTTSWSPERAIEGWRRVAQVAEIDGVPVADFGAAGLPIARLAPASARPLAALQGHWRGVSGADDGAGGIRMPRPGAGARAFRCTPGTTRLEAWLEPQWLLFQAPAAGRYVLTATHGSSPLVTDAPAVPADAAIGDVEPGAVLLLDAPALGSAALDLVHLELPRSAPSWPVLAEDVAPGEVVRLSLPAEILAEAPPESLRLVAGENVIPFVRVEHDLPRAGARLPPPRQTGQDGARITLELDVPAPAGLLTQLELRAARPPAHARVTLAYRAAVRPGVPALTRSAGTYEWTCEERTAGDCPLLVDVSIPTGTELVEAAIQNGASQPLEIAAARFWQAAHEIVFAWPAGGEVRLVSGFGVRHEDGPRADALRELLLTRVARPARVDLATAAAQAEGTARLLRIGLLAALAAAGVVLLVVLARALQRRA